MPAGDDPKSVRIRLARDHDHDAILALFRSGAIEGQLRDNDTGADIDRLVEAYFSDEGASGFWVADREDQVVGMIGVQRTRKDTAEVRRLRVHPDFRRCGIGSMLLEEAMSFCRAHGYLKVALDVRIERGPAIALFKSYGFVLAKTTDHGGHALHEFYMDLYSDPGSTTRRPKG